jgi:EpsG family
MLPYWGMFIFPALVALFADWPPLGGPNWRTLAASGRVWAPVWLILTLLIGYRYHVGGDWGNYHRTFKNLIGRDVYEVIQLGDPGYQLFNFISIQMDWGIIGVNLLCGAIFAFGLVQFCRIQPRPSLALAVSVPYLLIVVGMGYTRQGVALGLVMLALVELRNKPSIKYIIWLIAAATFHRTAVVLLPFIAIAGSKNRYWTVSWSLMAFAILYYILLANDEERLYNNYIVLKYESQGALVRLAMNAVPALLLLASESRFPFTETERPVWRWFAIISLVLFGAFFASPDNSAALDRMALYLLPLQVVVFTRLPFVFGGSAQRGNRGMPLVTLANSNATLMPVSNDSILIAAAVLFYYAAVQFVWLSYADNAVMWVPYRFYPLELREPR